MGNTKWYRCSNEGFTVINKTGEEQDEHMISGPMSTSLFTYSMPTSISQPDWLQALHAIFSPLVAEMDVTSAADEKVRQMWDRATTSILERFPQLDYRIGLFISQTMIPLQGKKEACPDTREPARSNVQKCDTVDVTGCDESYKLDCELVKREESISSHSDDVSGSNQKDRLDFQSVERGGVYHADTATGDTAGDMLCSLGNSFEDENFNARESEGQRSSSPSKYEDGNNDHSDITDGKHEQLVEQRPDGNEEVILTGTAGDVTWKVKCRGRQSNVIDIHFKPTAQDVFIDNMVKLVQDTIVNDVAKILGAGWQKKIHFSVVARGVDVDQQMFFVGSLKDAESETLVSELKSFLEYYDMISLCFGFTVRLSAECQRSDELSRFLDYVKRQRTILKVDNECCLGMASAIIVARGHPNREKWAVFHKRGIKGSGRDIKRLAQDLHRTAGVEIKEQLSTSDFAAFQALLLPKYRLIIVGGLDTFVVLYRGRPGKSTIFLVSYGDAYFPVITTKGITSFKCRMISGFCEVCMRPYLCQKRKEYSSKKHNCKIQYLFDVERLAQCGKADAQINT